MSKGDPCTVEECVKPQTARGWCTKHYGRVRRTGSLYHPEDQRYNGPELTLEPVPRQTRQEKFDSLCTVSGEHWLWTGTLRRADGVPLLTHNTWSTSARRYSWARHTGGDLSRIYAVRPTCGEELCVAPGHLEAVMLCRVRQEQADARAIAARTTGAAR